MSYHDPNLPHGARGVAALADAPAVERRVVEAIRLWLTGPEAQAEVWRGFAAEQGAEAGAESLRALEEYLEALAKGVTRKLWRHRLDCPCLGADEAALAEAVTAAAAGDRARARASLSDLLRADALPLAVSAAAALGAALAAAPEVPPRGGSATRTAEFRRLH